MNRTYHHTSHLGPMSVDHLLPPTTLPLRARLRLYLIAAENKLRMAVQYDNGDMWARAWAAYKDCTEQLSLLDAIDNGTITTL